MLGASSLASGIDLPPPYPIRCGICRWSMRTPQCCSIPIPLFATERRESGAPGKMRTSRSPPAISRIRASKTRNSASDLRAWSHTIGGMQPSSGKINCSERRDTERHTRDLDPRSLRRQQPAGMAALAGLEYERTARSRLCRPWRRGHVYHRCCQCIEPACNEVGLRSARIHPPAFAQRIGTSRDVGLGRCNRKSARY
jgi:hypothetical protein